MNAVTTIKRLFFRKTTVTLRISKRCISFSNGSPSCSFRIRRSNDTKYPTWSASRCSNNSNNSKKHASSTAVNQAGASLAKPDGNSTLTWLVKSMEDCVINILPSYTSQELSNIKVLDIGCGVGNYCQRMANIVGFDNVYGIDISPSQIDICNKVQNIQSKQNDKTIEFEVFNALELSNNEEYSSKFGIINASWIYNYACNEKELFQMISGTYKCLIKNGIHTGMLYNPMLLSDDENSWIKYGVQIGTNKYPMTKLENGEKMVSKFALEGGKRVREIDIDIDNNNGNNNNGNGNGVIDKGVLSEEYFYSDETLIKLFEEAGFDNIEFIEPKTWDLTNSTMNAKEEAIFQSYIKINPEMIAFRAYKY